MPGPPPLEGTWIGGELAEGTARFSTELSYHIPETGNPAEGSQSCSAWGLVHVGWSEKASHGR